MLLGLAQTAWGMVDAVDLTRYGGDPEAAIAGRGWDYMLVCRQGVFYAAVLRSDADVSKHYPSVSKQAALGEAYVAALRRERSGRAN